MRTYLPFAALAAFCLSGGCTIYEQRPARDDDVPRAEQCASRSDDAAEDIGTSPGVAAAVDDDQPPAAHAPREEGTFEMVARFVLGSIPYKDCGAGGRGDLDITFMPNGSVQKVVVWADAWSEPAKQCVSERFAIAHLAPFAGDARTVRWHADLEGEGDGSGWGT